MTETRSSIQRLNRTASLLGRLLLCLSLLLNLSIVAVEELRWSATDQALDNHCSSAPPLLAKTNEGTELPGPGKEKVNPDWWPPVALGSLAPPPASPAQTAWQRRAPPVHDSFSLQAPFPPRAPTT